MFILPERGQHRVEKGMLVTAGMEISLWFSVSMGEWEPWSRETVSSGVSVGYEVSCKLAVKGSCIKSGNLPNFCM